MDPTAPTPELLRLFRYRAKVTQLEAAAYFELPPGTYRDYEQGRREPRPIVRSGIEEGINRWEAECYRQTGEIFFDEPIPDGLAELG